MQALFSSCIRWYCLQVFGSVIVHQLSLIQLSCLPVWSTLPRNLFHGVVLYFESVIELSDNAVNISRLLSVNLQCF